MGTITDLEAFKSGLSLALATELQIKPESLHLFEIRAGKVAANFESVCLYTDSFGLGSKCPLF